MNDASDSDMETFIRLLKLDQDSSQEGIIFDGGIKVTTLASAFEKGVIGFIRHSARLLSNEVKVVEEYDPYIEFEVLRETNQRELKEMESKYGTKEMCLTLEDKEAEIEKWTKDRQEGKHIHPNSNNTSQIGSVDGCLESIALTEIGEYVRRCQVQRMADIPPMRKEMTKL